jgi:hypothetical protein
VSELQNVFEAMGMSPALAKVAAEGRSGAGECGPPVVESRGSRSAWSWREDTRPRSAWSWVGDVEPTASTETRGGLGGGEAVLRQAAVSELGMSPSTAAVYASSIATRESAKSGPAAAGRFCEDVARSLRSRGR